jgi:A/G-specific adenine glycosylase
MHKMAVVIVKKYNGIMPMEKEDLLNLPGVGEYIASALRCFSLNYPEPILDTNTVRIIGRYFGMNTSESSRRDKKFRQIYSTIINLCNPREFNYAMLDLGALICKPKNPRCNECPIQDSCNYPL